VSQSELQAVVAGAVGLLVVLIVVWRWRWRRQVVRRIASVISRLENVGTVDVVGRGRLETSLAALERAAGIGALRVSDAGAAVDRFANACRALPLGVVICDENGDLVFSNEWDGMPGVGGREQSDEVVGESTAEPAPSAIMSRLLAEAVDGRAGHEAIELHGPPARTLELSAQPLANDARSVGAVGVLEDVSDRRRLEAVRREFVANVGHELQTPLAAIGVLAETLAAEDDAAVAARLAARVGVESARVGRVLEGLLALARVEGEEARRRDRVPVHLVLAEAAEPARSTAASRGIRVDVHEPPRRLSVLGDRRQLASALHALVENAVAFSPDGAEVVVDTRTNGTWVEITVSDTGAGIPARDLDRIFERFYRVDRSGSGRGAGGGRQEGSGLGLAIVRHVAANHGGEVRVQSQEGGGSTFTLRLPAGPGPVAVSLPAPAEAG
jgi:two-component system sensor histidine kinase SenX3